MIDRRVRVRKMHVPENPSEELPEKRL